MHEYSIVSALVDQVDKLARSREATAVHRLEVRIGELSGVEIELLETAYDLFREGTICAGATLAVRPVPARWACPSCDGQVARGLVLRCPDCAVPPAWSRATRSSSIGSRWK